MRSGFTHDICGALRQTFHTMTIIFTVTSCSEKLVTTATHNVSLNIREDLGPSLLHASPAELPTHNNTENGDYSCKNLESVKILKWERSMSWSMGLQEYRQNQCPGCQLSGIFVRLVMAPSPSSSPFIII